MYYIISAGLLIISKLQLLLDEEFGGNCVLPINKSSLFHKYLGTILAFDICTGDLCKRGDGVMERRTK